MKILFMADIPPNPDSGAAGTEYQTIIALRNLGHEVEAIWADGLPHKIQHGNLHYILELPFAYRKVMLEKLRVKEYDIIHVNQPHGYLAAKAVKHKKSVFIHRSHGFELRVKSDLGVWQKLYYKDNRAYWRRLLSKVIDHFLDYNNRQITHYADGHIVSASQCKEFLYNKMGVPQDRIMVIPQASPNIFLSTPLSSMSPCRLKKILYIGQFAFIKAPMIVAKVMDNLSIIDNELSFTWVCSKEHHHEAKKLLSPVTLNRVTLIDWVPQNELIKIYDDHGIFLFPSFFEGFGKVFLEAMSRGLCVVAADNGGAHDVITNGMDGVLVPTGSVEAMVNACLEILKNTDKAICVSSGAVKTARRYTWERVARETVDFYKKRLKSKALK